MHSVYRELREEGTARADAFFIAFGFWVHMDKRYPEVEVAPHVLQRQRASVFDDPRGEADR